MALPVVLDELSPVVEVVPLQRLAHSMAIARRVDPTRPAVSQPAVAAVDTGGTRIKGTGVEVAPIGGGPEESGEELLGPFREHLRRRLTFQRMPRHERAGLRERTGSMGPSA